MEYKDYYKILGVDRKASDSEIKSKYRKLAKKYHPDLNPNDEEAEKKFKEVTEAYEVLGNKEKREQYDNFGSSYNFRQGENFDPSHYGFDFSNFGGGGQTYSYTSMNDQTGEGFSDFFNMFFGGGGNPFGSSAGFRSGESQARQRPRYEVDISISLEDAYHGKTKDLALNINGESKVIPIKIPKGITPGKKLRIKGERFDLDGDIYAKINIIDSKKKLDGLDLIQRIELTPWDAALGTDYKVETLEGPTINVKIPKNIKAGKKIRIPGRGFRDLKDHKGDLFLEIAIDNPNTLTDEQLELYEKLRELS